MGAAFVTVAVSVLLLPSITGFTAGVDADRSCLAIRDGWHADRGPDAADKVVIHTFYAHPTAEEMQVIGRANARLTWVLGRGACVPESRHRLIISGAGLSALAAVIGAIAFVRRKLRQRVAGGQPHQALPLAPSA
jgi:hypothetical protein